MFDISALNQAQLEAVTAADGPVLVIAGAGSGKTRTLVHRLAWLADQGVSPESMLLLTFTRKASREMLTRAADLLGYSLGGVHGGTFHGFAYSVLRQYRPAWARGAVTVMDASDSLAVIQQCKEKLKIGKGDRSFPKNQTVIGLLSKARNKEIPLQDLLQRESPHLLQHTGDLESLESAYRAYRREHGLLDYDDLLFELEDLLRGTEGNDFEGIPAQPGLAPLFRERFRYLMVDEYQDTNRVQARLVRMLAGENGNIMAVGDDAQSIYAFRGADVRNILDFPKLFPATRIIRLEENYRSTQLVLDVANAVLAPAMEGFRKNLYTSKQVDAATPRVRMVHPMSDLSQAGIVANRVEELLTTYRADEIAVLFRAGYQSYHLEVELAKRGILFRKYGGLRYSEAAHIKDVLAYVRLTINPLDLPSFSRLASLCKGVGPRTAQKIYAVAGQSSRDGNRASLQKACAKYPELWADLTLLDKIRQQNLNPAQLLALVLEQYQPRMQMLFPEDWPRRQKGLEELQSLAVGYEDVDQFVADLSLETPEDEREDDEKDRIVLSTIHSAKGLEWDAVIILDLVEERFPSRRAVVREEDFEEERRLMYVACTRARECLDLFVPLTLYNRQRCGNEPVSPSPFVQDLPPSVEEWRESYMGRVFKKETAGAAGFGGGRQAGRDPFGRALPGGATPGAWAVSAAKNADGFGGLNRNGGRAAGTETERFRNSGEFPEGHPDNSSQGGRSSLESIRQELARGEIVFCRHKIFGRGRVMEFLDPDKCRVNFPGFGIKVILSDYLSMED